MTTQMTEDEVYEVAKKRVKAKRDFYGNLVAWAIVNIILVIVWVLTDVTGYMWFLWPLCIWGFFVLVHFIQTFVFKPKPEKRAIEKEAEKIRREQG
ncbi:2TM domain-containing protein [Chloroflexota bacterium]